MLVQLSKEDINRGKFLIDLLPDACNLTVASHQPSFLKNIWGLLSKDLEQFVVVGAKALGVFEVQVEYS